MKLRRAIAAVAATAPLAPLAAPSAFAVRRRKAGPDA